MLRSIKHLVFLSFYIFSSAALSETLTLENRVLNPLALAENAEAYLLVEGAGNRNTKLIVLDGESLGGDSSTVASQCDLASNGVIKVLDGKGKGIKKKYKSVKKFTKRHKLESVWIVAKVETLQDVIEFFCVFSSKTNSLYSPLLANAKDHYIEKFNKANKETELALNKGQFRSNFVNEKISEFEFTEVPEDRPVKGKFETSEEFARRVGDRPLLIRKSYNFGKVSKANPMYDADTQVASFDKLGDYHEPYEGEYRDGVDKVNFLLEENVSTTYFDGSNSFGATRSVTKTSGEKYYVRVDYPYLFWTSGLPWNFSSYERIKIPIEIARDNLEHTAYNIEISIDSDSVIRDLDWEQATFSSPRSTDIKYKTYIGNVTSVQLGNTKTGELYLSHQQREHKDQLLFVEDSKTWMCKARVSDIGWTMKGPIFLRQRSHSYFEEEENKYDLCYRYSYSESGVLIPFGVTKLLPVGSEIYETSGLYNSSYSAYRFEIL
jgi:hypothetical protein